MVKYGFYNSVNGDRRYNATDFGQFLDGIITDGLFSNWGNALHISPTTDWGIIVDTGKVWANATYTINTSTLYLPLEPAPATLYRWDYVVVQIDEASRVNSIKIITGTPASSPQGPNLSSTTYNNDTLHTYRFASIYVRPGRTTLNYSDISIHIGSSVKYDLQYAAIAL